MSDRPCVQERHGFVIVEGDQVVAECLVEYRPEDAQYWITRLMANDPADPQGYRSAVLRAAMAGYSADPLWVRPDGILLAPFYLMHGFEQSATPGVLVRPGALA